MLLSLNLVTMRTGKLCSSVKHVVMYVTGRLILQVNREALDWQQLESQERIASGYTYYRLSWELLVPYEQSVVVMHTLGFISAAVRSNIHNMLLHCKCGECV